MIHVLDTSVILSDPKALERLTDKDVVIPLATLIELEGKRRHPELGYAARTALRYLDALTKEGNLTEGVETPEGGSVRVEINHIDDAGLPAILQKPENDNRILAVASNLANEGENVTLLTNDLPLRLKANVAKIDAEELDYSKSDEMNWGEVVNIETESYIIDEFYDDGWCDAPEPLQANAPVLMRAGSQSALGRAGGADGKIHELWHDPNLKVSARNKGQHFALDALSDLDIGIVSLGGKAGSGKTVMALAAGIAALADKRRTGIEKVMVFRPIQAVGDQELGFLPGTQEEKMAPWAEAVQDALKSFMKPNEIRDLFSYNKIEVLPLTHIRGRTLKNAFVIIDEAQNLDLMTLVTAMTRLSEGSRIVLTHDLTQRDNLKVGKHDGIARIVDKLSGNPLFSHINLEKSERSRIAELVAGLFDL